MKKLTLLFAALLAVSMSFATVVTFDFSNASAFGYDNPAAGGYSQVATGGTIAQDGVTLTASFASGNGLRFFANTNTGAINLRAYKDASFTISAPANAVITDIQIAGTNLGASYVTAAAGTYDSGSWTGSAASVTMNVIKSTVQMNTMTVTYSSDGDTPVDTTVVPVDTTVVPVDTTIVYNTCAEVNAVTANTDMTLGEVTVVFIKGSNIYVQDATGTTLVYTNNYGNLLAGDRVSGIAGQAKLYNGLPELAATTAFADLTIVRGEAAPVIFDAQAAPTAANVNEVMMFRGVQMPSASFASGRASNITGTFAGEQVAFRNNWKEAYTFDSTKTYSMLGCVAIYNSSIQVYVTDFAEEIAPVDTDTIPVPPVIETIPLTFDAGMWNIDGAKFAAWAWGGELNGMFTDFFVPGNDSNLYLAQIPAVADSILFVRFASTVETPSWQAAIWNQTADYGIKKSDMYFTITDWTSGVWGTPVVYNTCAEVNAVTANTDMTLGEVTVVFAKGSNIYVQDATGTTLVYTNNYGDLVAGDRVQGIAGQAKLYNGLPELAATTAFADLTIVPGEAPVIFDAQAAPTAANVNEVMMFRGVQMPSASFGTSRATNITGIFAGEQVAFRNNWKEAFTFDSTKTYTMLGCVAIYNNNIQVYVTNFEEEVAPAQSYYIKNNWDGVYEWTWAEMTQNELFPYQYEFTGVFGGTGVNIGTAMVEFPEFWFPVESFDIPTGGLVPQAMDTVYFNFNSADTTLYAEVIGRPVVHHDYYIKNNWDGAADWTWVAMTEDTTFGTWEYTGVYGGNGVNINTAMTDEGADWLPDSQWVFVDSAFVPQPLDTLYFVYDPNEKTLLVSLVGRPAGLPETFYIKNNWNGGEWMWMEMELNPGTTPDDDVWYYIGVFGTDGVNITSNYMENELWFPVENWILADSGWTPAPMDTIIFLFSPADTILAVDLIGRPDPAPEVVQIKNNWDGGEWAWMDMEPALAPHDYLWFYVGVFGGTGVNITSNYMENELWFPVENWILADSGWTPAPMDTIAFEFNAQDTILTAMLVGRPAPEPEVFMIKNNWNGAADWTWEEMTQNALFSYQYEYTGVFGGTGVNITSNYIAGELWFPVADFELAPDALVPQLGDTVYFNYNSIDTTIYAEVIGRPAEAPVHYYIKNNWNGGEWTWAEMTQNATSAEQYEYTGVFGGFGVNINTAASDADAIWFPISDFDILPDALVPQEGDTVYFNYNSIDTTIYAEVIGRPAPIVYNTCADVNAITENTEMTLNAVTVVFAKGSYIYVKDATATTLVYTNMYGDLKPGDLVKGIAGTATLYNGLPELKPTTAFADLIITEYPAPRIPTAPGAPTVADINKVMMFNNVIMPDSATFGSAKASNITGVYYGDSIIFRNQWKDAYTFDGNKTYSMIGCVGIYNGTIQVYVTDIQEYAPVTYYIKNNWNGTTVWEWAEMTQNELFDYQYEYTGVFGGTGVNIDTEMSDFATFWFSVENFDIDPDGLVPQAGDTVYFNFNSLDETLYAHVVGRPSDVPVQYYIKNNWNGGEWTWEEMTPADDGNITWSYTGIFGGTGVNINTAASDAGAQWLPIDSWVLTTVGYEPAAGDEILFEYNSHTYTLTATYMGGDGLETITFQRDGETVKVIKNGQLYIIRDGKMYNALGAQVR